MLKTFMQPGNTKTTPSRNGQPAYESARPAEPAKAPEPVKPDPRPETQTAAPVDDGSKLIVGPNIKLKGSEITDCEILVVEGRVEASMNSRDIRIAEGGVFSGKAEIDVAEVRGTFEGEITARKRLVIYATGKVTGVIRYGAMMIEEGGSISGDVARLDGPAGPARLAEVSVPAPMPESGQDKVAAVEDIHSSSAFARSQLGRRTG